MSFAPVPTELNAVLVADAHTLSGALRFRGTRVPVQALLDSLSDGQSIDDFIEDFPDVTRDQALAVIRWEQNQVRRQLGVELI